MKGFCQAKSFLWFQWLVCLLFHFVLWLDELRLNEFIKSNAETVRCIFNFILSLATLLAHSKREQHAQCSQRIGDTLSCDHRECPIRLFEQFKGDAWMWVGLYHNWNDCLLYQKHQLVNKALHNLFDHFHALAIEAYTPDQWAQMDGQSNARSPKCLGGSKSSKWNHCGIPFFLNEFFLLNYCYRLISD